MRGAFPVVRATPEFWVRCELWERWCAAWADRQLEASAAALAVQVQLERVEVGQVDDVRVDGHLVERYGAVSLRAKKADAKNA